MFHAVREAGVFHPTRQLSRFFFPEHDMSSKTTAISPIIIITQINTSWLCPIGDSQGSLPQTSTRQDKLLRIQMSEFRGILSPYKMDIRAYSKVNIKYLNRLGYDPITKIDLFE